MGVGGRISGLIYQRGAFLNAQQIICSSVSESSTRKYSRSTHQTNIWQQEILQLIFRYSLSKTRIPSVLTHLLVIKSCQIQSFYLIKNIFEEGSELEKINWVKSENILVQIKNEYRLNPRNSNLRQTIVSFAKMIKM